MSPVDDDDDDEDSFLGWKDFRRSMRAGYFLNIRSGHVSICVGSWSNSQTTEIHRREEGS